MIANRYGFDTVQSLSPHHQDVTEEYTDLEARIAVVRQEEARPLDLLCSATTIDNYFKAESHLIVGLTGYRPSRRAKPPASA